MSRRARGLRLGILLAVLGVPLFVGPAGAHAVFVRSEPAANATVQTGPERLRLWFTESLESGFSEVIVLDASGRRVDRGDSLVAPNARTSMAVSLSPLSSGTYTVAWKALSALDGHVTRGVYSLLVGVEQSAPPPAQVPVESTPATPVEAAVRWVGYLSAMAALGVFLTTFVVFDPIISRFQLEATARLPVLRAVRRLGLFAAALLAVATVAALILQASLVAGRLNVTELAAIIGSLLSGSRFGVLWLARAASLLLMGGLLLAMAGSRAAAPWVGGLVAAILLGTFSLNSHAAATRSPGAVAVDWLHIVAAGAWVGGLFTLGAALPALLRTVAPAQRWRVLAGVTVRFSTLALVSVTVLVGAGVYLAWLHVGSVAALLQTLYGKSLLAKLGLAVPLLALGAVNLLIIRRRLTEGTRRARPTPDPGPLGGWLWRTVSAESLLALLVLLATGLLTSVSPARQTLEQIVAARPFEMRASAGDLMIVLQIAPARPGTTSAFTVLPRDQDGRPVEAARADLRFRYLNQLLGERRVTTTRAPDGRFFAQGAILTLPGQWETEVVVRRAGRDDARTAFRYRITAAGAEELTPVQASAARPSLGDIRFVASTAVAALGLGLVLFAALGAGLAARRGKILAAGGAAVMVLAGISAVRVYSIAGTGGMISAMVNPYPATADSLAAGEQIYRAQCQVCHGASGGGDGPAAVTLNPRPVDLRVHMAMGHPDGQLFLWISDGIAGTGMPAFKRTLSEEQRWHAINFIKTFAPVDR